MPILTGSGNRLGGNSPSPVERKERTAGDNRKVIACAMRLPDESCG